MKYINIIVTNNWHYCYYSIICGDADFIGISNLKKVLCIIMNVNIFFSVPPLAQRAYVGGILCRSL